jgi:hypothetical protein
MTGKLFIFGFALAFASSLGAADTTLSAVEIANRNAAARGGLQAWRAVLTLKESGKLAAGGNDRGPALPPQHPGDNQPIATSPRLQKEAQLPLVMYMERPRKVRVELQFRGQTAVQVYDGSNGWKLRPYLNRLEVEPFNSDELRLASLQSDLDGPLIDYAAKGTRVELDGAEKVEGRNTYKIKLTMKDGRATHVWIDAETFLEAKIEGAPRRLDGQEHQVEIYFRDYRTVDGLRIPFDLETRVVPLELTSVSHGPARTKESSYPPETIIIDEVKVNLNLDASLFDKLTVDTVTAAVPKSH